MTEIGGRWFADRLQEFNKHGLEYYFHSAINRDMTEVEKKNLPLYIAAAHNGGPAKVINTGIQFALFQVGVELSDEERTEKYTLPVLGKTKIP